MEGPLWAQAEVTWFLGRGQHQHSPQRAEMSLDERVLHFTRILVFIDHCYLPLYAYIHAEMFTMCLVTILAPAVHSACGDS